MNSKFNLQFFGGSKTTPQGVNFWGSSNQINQNNNNQTNNNLSSNSNSNTSSSAVNRNVNSERIGQGTLISVPRRDPEPNALTNLRNNLSSIFGNSIQNFDANQWNEAKDLSKYVLEQQKSLIGQLTGDNGQLTRNNALTDEIANIARTGNIPSTLTDRMNASVNQGLQSSMGNMLNSLANRGVLNSSVTTAGTNQLSQAAADAYNRNYQDAYRSVLSGLGSALQGSQNNTASTLSALGAISQIPSQAYENIGSQLTPAYNFWKDWQNFYQSDDPYETIYAQDPAKADNGGCLTGDTLVTLEDGREIPISDLKDNDKLKTWDFDNGRLTSAPLTLLYKGTPKNGADIIRIEFDDGSRAGVIFEHLFFDLTEGKFVAVNYHNMDYKGHMFAKVNTDGKVVPVRVSNIFLEGKAHETYGAQCRGYLNHLAAGFITGNDGQLGLCNMFDFDTQNMTFDKEKKLADLEKYGKLPYKNFEGVISKNVFDNNHIEDFSVAIGKGLIHTDWFISYLSKFALSFLE